MHPAIHRINEILPLFNQDIQRHLQVIELLKNHKADVIRSVQNQFNIAAELKTNLQ